MAINEWSTTAASNASGVTGVNWAEGQAPSTVNDSARAMMADVATWYGQASGKIPEYLTSISGTNTITAAGPAAMSAYAAGQRFTFIPANTNTGATTINITPSGGSALGAKNIFGNAAALGGGEIRANVPVIILYDGTQFNIIGTSSAANGSSLVLIGASQTASTSQSIDFTSASYATAFDGTFDEVEFHLSGVTTTTDALIFRGIVGTGAGPTYHTAGTDYGWAGNRTDEAGNNAFGAATSAYMSLSGEGTVGNAATRSVNGIVRMFNPSNTAFHKMIMWELQHISEAGVVNRVTGSARYIATTAWTAFRFHFGTFGVNTIAAGKFTCFGVKKA